jgi:hypothetical protein
MILLSDNYLVFQTASGENIPYTAESVSVELMGDAASMFDPEFIKHAAAAVFHYYRDELGRESVSVAEFSLSLEKVLRGFKLAESGSPVEIPGPRVLQSDLRRFATDGCELFFFPRLRDELHTLLLQGPQMLCFQGLRPCVKKITGSQRWSQRCQAMHDQIVDFLRSCMTHETTGISCALVVK